MFSKKEFAIVSRDLLDWQISCSAELSMKMFYYFGPGKGLHTHFQNY